MRPEVGHRYKAGDTPPAGLTVAELCRVNVLRCMTDFKHPLQAWSLFEWAGAVAGEAGEACNVAKKLIRFRNGLEFMNKRGDMPEREREELLHKLGKELADTVHYACLAFAAAGLDMEMYLIDVFNTVSDENGSKIKIPPSRPAKNTY